MGPGGGHSGGGTTVDGEPVDPYLGRERVLFLPRWPFHVPHSFCMFLCCRNSAGNRKRAQISPEILPQNANSGVVFGQMSIEP